MGSLVAKHTAQVYCVSSLVAKHVTELSTVSSLVAKQVAQLPHPHLADVLLEQGIEASRDLKAALEHRGELQVLGIAAPPCTAGMQRRLHYQPQQGQPQPPQLYAVLAVR